MGHTLIICEKPTAAKAISEALANSKPVKKQEDGSRAYWYEFERGGRRYACAPAVGHLFTLKQKGKGWNYPAFDVDWIPSFRANRAAAFSEPYFRNIEGLVRDTEDVIVATDYDDEGEVIGANILRFILGRKDAARMRFSTMTKEELLESFAHPLKLNKNLVESGYTRHYLDYMWGVNLTRALTLAIKSSGKRFRILSTGRVQGPVLHMLAKHEKKIRAFKPKPFWMLEAEVTIGKQQMKAGHAKDKLWDRKEAEAALKKAQAKDAIVKAVTKKITVQAPPKPYNTTAFLADIYRYFGYSPQQGLSIAESLYQAGIISYPRTSSEKLPPDINYRKIISGIGKQPQYQGDCKFLLAKKDLKPEEGKKTDSAHPAIYPTGALRKMGDKQQKVYDLVVRRFLATFGDPAKRESQKVALDINGELFSIFGKRTVEAGWTKLYGKYAAREEVILPELKAGGKVPVKKVEMLEKETQPPARYSQGSVLKEMEAHGLGTKATRAQILQILYNRGYVAGRSIMVTELGMELSDILEKNVPDVISEKLTRHLEEMTGMVEHGKAKREDVLEEAKNDLIRISASFKKKEKKIGDELVKAVIETQDRQSILGQCNSCSGTLKVHKSWRTKKRFVGCTGYKKGCRTGFPLPKEGTIMTLEKQCEECKTPMIQVSIMGKRPFRMCLDPNCVTKKDWLDKNKLRAAQIESRKGSKLAEQMKCPVCSKSFLTKRSLTLHGKSHKTETKAAEKTISKV